MVPGWQYGARRLAGRAVARFIPILGFALTVYDLWQLFRPRTEAGFDMTGWDLVCGAPGGSEMTTGWACEFVGDRKYFVSGLDLTNATTITGMGAVQPISPPFYEGEILNRYERNTAVGAPEYAPGKAPAAVPQPYPEWWATPWIDPFSLPIAQPVPSPQPNRNPGRDQDRRNPWRSPREQTQRGTGRWHLLGPNLKPYQTPAITVTVGPNGRVNVDKTPHDRRPPNKGEKERKTIMNLGPGILATVVNTITEGADIVSAIYDSLPVKITKWKGRDGRWRDQDVTLQAKLATIYRHSDEIDLTEAIKNLLTQDQMDRYYAGQQQQVADTYGDNPFYNRPVGVSTGPAM